MQNTSIRLAAVGLSAAAALLLAPVVASAQAPHDPVTATTSRRTTASAKTSIEMSMKHEPTMDMSKMRIGAAKMPGTAMPGHRKASAGMSSMAIMTGMAQKMRGHATMAEAMRAHPELEKQCMSMMRAHPELRR